MSFTPWQTAHNGRPAMRMVNGIYYNHDGEPQSAECSTGLGIGCDGGDCSCPCHSEHAPFFPDNEAVADWHRD